MASGPSLPCRSLGGDWACGAVPCPGPWHGDIYRYSSGKHGDTMGIHGDTINQYTVHIICIYIYGSKLNAMVKKSLWNWEIMNILMGKHGDAMGIEWDYNGLYIVENMVIQ